MLSKCIENEHSSFNNNVLTSCFVYYTIWRSSQLAALISSEFSEQNPFVCVCSNCPTIGERFSGMACINIRHGLPFCGFIILVCRPHNISLSVRAPFDVRNDVKNKTWQIDSSWTQLQSTSHHQFTGNQTPFHKNRLHGSSHQRSHRNRDASK